jgi:two-component system cell cycle sensor histidine kinase/response regulator CckA
MTSEASAPERPRPQAPVYSHSFLSAVVGPPPVVHDADVRRRSRLLGVLIAVMVVIFACVDFGKSRAVPGYQVPWIGYLFLLGTFVLNRAGRYGAASRLVLVMFPVVILWMIVVAGPSADFTQLNFLVLGILLASLLRGTPETVAFAAASVAMVAVLPFVLPAAAGRRIEFVTPLAVNGVGAALTVTIAIHRDLVERERLERERAAEARLRQAEKMEAIGRLAGGIAHDFNNQLTAIIGFSDLLRDGVTDPRLRQYVDLVLKSGRTSADLVRQLLAFARQETLPAVPVDVHRVLGDVMDLLRRTLDKRIAVVGRLEASPSVVKAGAARIQTALMNIALNAADAMPNGGTLTFETDTPVFDASGGGLSDVPVVPGRYVRIRVTDTGTGMDDATRGRIFEPFFSTKGARGTGLGLAVVYGVTKSYGGFVGVESALGRGSVLSIHFPAVSETPEPRAATPAQARPPVPLRILVIDDEPSSAGIGAALLSDAGHVVRTYTDSAAALRDYETTWRDVDLILLDLVMPPPDGRVLFHAMRRINPVARILLWSGYAPADKVRDLLESGALGIVEKPVVRENLLRRVAELSA